MALSQYYFKEASLAYSVADEREKKKKVYLHEFHYCFVFVVFKGKTMIS